MKNHRKQSPRRARASHTRRSSRRWSGQVTKTSHALDLKPGIFTSSDPKRIARSLKRSSEASAQRKSSSYRSAASMLTFYLNRGGRGLSATRRRILERAKIELRHLYGKE